MTRRQTSQQMNFFESQDLARRNTRRLVLLFIAAVVCIVVAVYLATVLAVWMSGAYVAFKKSADASAFSAVSSNPILIVSTVVGSLLFIGGGTLYKIMALRGGGPAIAEYMGGKRIHADTDDADEQRVLNVVTEMAIASGVPCPPVFVMDRERGINAFAAGYSSQDAAIGVSRGCINHLTRDELQGVVAHEFSHILNGDMRLNLKLMGVVHGILAIGIAGHGLMRAAAYSSYGSSRDRSGGIIFGVVLGGLLMGIGFVGTFFGGLIKASVSRQREYLADAAAVQFTRNPDGIGNALRRIGGHSTRGFMDNHHAMELSHMFFNTAVVSKLGAMSATHPPLDERVKRVLPSWDGSWLKTKKSEPFEPRRRTTKTIVSDDGRTTMTITREQIFSDVLMAGTAAELIEQLERRGAVLSNDDAADAIEHIGQPRPDHLAYANLLIEAIPMQIRTAAQDPWMAQAVVGVLLLDAHDQSVREKQLDLIEQSGGDGLVRTARSLMKDAEQLPMSSRLPLVELAITALRDLSEPQYRKFRALVEALVRADERIDTFEWSLQRLLLHHLDAQFDAPGHVPVQYYSLNRLDDACGAVCSMLAHAGSHGDTVAAQRAISSAASVLGFTSLTLAADDHSESAFASVDAAIEQLAAVTPRLKEQVVRACVSCVEQDGRITVHEAELLRAVAGALECPMPPILADRESLELPEKSD